MRLNTKSEGLGKSALKTHVSLMTQKAKRRRWKENAYGLTNKESNFPGQKRRRRKQSTHHDILPTHPSIHPSTQHGQRNAITGQEPMRMRIGWRWRLMSNNNRATLCRTTSISQQKGGPTPDRTPPFMSRAQHFVHLKSEKISAKPKLRHTICLLTYKFAYLFGKRGQKLMNWELTWGYSKKCLAGKWAPLGLKIALWLIKEDYKKSTLFVVVSKIDQTGFQQIRWTRGDIYIYVYMSGYINPYYSHANWLILNFFLQKNSTTITAALDNVLMMTSSQSKKRKMVDPRTWEEFHFD